MGKQTVYVHTMQYLLDNENKQLTHATNMNESQNNLGRQKETMLHAFISYKTPENASQSTATKIRSVMGMGARTNNSMEELRRHSVEFD